MPTFDETIPLPLGPSYAGEVANLRAKEYNHTGVQVGGEISTGFTEYGTSGNFILKKSFTVADGEQHRIKVYLNGNENDDVVSIISPPAATQTSVDTVESIAQGASDYAQTASENANDATLAALDAASQLDALTGGTGTAFTEAALAEAPTGGGGGLSGPSAVTLTFEDEANDPVPNVDFTVLTQGSGRSNVSGVATFGLPDGTYTVAARMTNGVVFANTTLTVAGTTALTITGQSVVITPPADPSMTTAYLYTYDEEGAIETGVVINFKLEVGPGGAGRSFNNKVFEATSDGTGLLQVELIREATYLAKREDGGKWHRFKTLDSGTMQLPDILGNSLLEE
jgi:hypothetical protein